MKIPEKLGCESEYSVGHQKDKLWHCTRKLPKITCNKFGAKTYCADCQKKSFVKEKSLDRSDDRF